MTSRREFTLFGLVVIMGFFILGSVVFGWTNPGQNPPGGNVAAPLNTGGGSQTKSGSLSIGGTLTVTGTSTLSGNVGVGTAGPETAFHVAGGDILLSNGRAIRIENNGGANEEVLTLNSSNNVIVNNSASGNLILKSGTAGTITFQDGGTENIRIDGDGKVGIGTSTIPEKLTVAGNVQADAYFYPSDARLKTDFRPTGGLAVINNLNGVSFLWKNSGARSAGLIAQEVELVLPEAVKTDPITGSKSLNYGALAGPIVEAIKELKRELDDKNRRIEELEAKVRELEAR